MSKDRIILHVDLNNFYASVEQLHRVELRGLPIAVCGNAELRKGIVLAKNILAKAMGVKTGDVIWEAKAKCPNLQVVLPNYSLYLRFSELARNIYEDYTDLIEPFGIDECWLDITSTVNLFGDGVTVANIIRNRLKEELGITASVGVSFCKIFAKLGSDYKKPNATTVISRENYRNFIDKLDISNLLYVGKATQKKLYNLGIVTIGHLADIDKEILISKLGKWGEYLHQFANGTDTSEVRKKSVFSVIKSVGNSLTTVRDMRTFRDVQIMINLLSDSVASRLREYGLRGSVVSIYVKDSNLLCLSRQMKINVNTSNSKEISKWVTQLFKKYYRGNFCLRLIGVQVSNLVEDSKNELQLDIFENYKSIDKQDKVDQAIDCIRNKFGYDSIKKGILMVDESLTEVTSPKEDNIIHPYNYFG